MRDVFPNGTIRARFGLVALAAVVALAVVCGSAIAAARPSHLGKPDVKEHIGGTFFLPVTAAVGDCFAAGDALSFPGATFAGSHKIWHLAGGNNWIEVKERVAGTTTTGGFTYTLRARLTYSGNGIDDIVGSGKVVITRSDGARIRGRATVFSDAFTTSSEQVIWSASPRCT